MKISVLALSLGLLAPFALAAPDTSRPHVIFVMADDMGWGQTGYHGHPVLETPHLDAMAEAGLRFDRFYANAPVCSPTRAGMLTGRSNDRTGVLGHGYALRRQEKTIAQALRDAGYVTGHFGKWHLNGYRGPGVPIFAEDPHGPGAFGFDEWVSVSNFYDMDPLMSRAGEFEAFAGDSSEIAVEEAVKFLEQHRGGGKPLFAVIWYGTPHSPFRASDEDMAPFASLDEESAHHHGELVAMDRSIGKLRAKLREQGLAENTLLVFCSDNGGLRGIEPSTTGGLRGFKGSLHEGGLRVPGIMEWPAVIAPGRTTDLPASTLDLFPTVADILGLPAEALLAPVDGESLLPLLAGDAGHQRARPLGFRYGKGAALVAGRHKLLCEDLGAESFQLYDLEADPGETRDLAEERPDAAARLRAALLEWNASVEASFAGKDYPEGQVDPAHPEPRAWSESPEYAPFFPEWKERWEYRSALDPSRSQGRGKGKAR